MLLKDKIINGVDHTNDLPLIARRNYRVIREDIETKDKLELVLKEVAKFTNIVSLSKINTTVIGEFEVGGLRYSYINLEMMLIENFSIQKNLKEQAIAVIQKILSVCADSCSNVIDLAGKVTPVNCAALDHYIDFLEKETYKGVWSDIMKYPFDVQNIGIKKHLMLGFASNSGKTIITRALATLYSQVSIQMSNRRSFDFDANTWNASVIDSFLVIIDDDNAESPVTEDYIKNFLNRDMPLNLAKSGVRWQAKYNGSSVIATNTEEAFFQEKVNSKRIALVRMDEELSGFTEQELDKLHNLTLGEIMGRIDIMKESKLFTRDNEWDNNVNETILELVRLKGAVSNRDLLRDFSKKEITAALGKAKTLTYNGNTMYGFKSDVKPMVSAEDEKTGNFNIALFKDLEDVSPIMQSTNFDQLAKSIMLVNDMQKETQPMIALVNTTSAKEEDIKSANGVILDVDNSKIKSLDELVIPYDFIAYETSSSTPDNLRYRIVVPFIESKTHDEYKAHVKMIEDCIVDDVDESCYAIAHRYFLGGKNVRIGEKFIPKLEYGEFEDNKDTPINNQGLIDTVTNATVGSRNNATFWAIQRAVEKNDKNLISEIIEASIVSEKEKQRFRKRFL